jgi:hypothetical protein
MKYEIPELTALTTAITAIQGAVGAKMLTPFAETPMTENEGIGAYADWE